MDKISEKISCAPMLDVTNKHFRYLLRLISPNCWLYTEMIHFNSIINGNRLDSLEFNEIEKPLVLQLGGSSPYKISKVSKLYQHYNYNEINLNIGCPSQKAQNDNFGACLMKDGNLVATLFKNAQAYNDIPITIKTRIGIDNLTSYDFFANFIQTLVNVNCNKFIIHSRSAILKNLNPKENRKIPPLNYDFVYQIKQDFPNKQFIINGGISSIEEIQNHLKKVDGVMLGRKLQKDPFFLNSIEQKIFKTTNLMSRKQIIPKLIEYIKNFETQIQTNPKVLLNIIRNWQALYYHTSKAKKFRIICSKAYKNLIEFEQKLKQEEFLL